MFILHSERQRRRRLLLFLVSFHLRTAAPQKYAMAYTLGFYQFKIMMA